MGGSTLLWLVGSIPVFVAGASAGRYYAAQGPWWALAAMLALYSVGNLMMVRVMGASGLALAMSVSSIAQLVLVNLVAFLVFGERLAPLQLLGIVLGFAGFVLMVLPARP